jgi:hypothetical protein
MLKIKTEIDNSLERVITSDGGSYESLTRQVELNTNPRLFLVETLIHIFNAFEEHVSGHNTKRMLFDCKCDMKDMLFQRIDKADSLRNESLVFWRSAFPDKTDEELFTTDYWWVTADIFKERIAAHLDALVALVPVEDAVHNYTSFFKDNEEYSYLRRYIINHIYDRT